MSEPSSIRKLLSDQNLGLLPYIDNCLKDIQAHFADKQGIFKLEPYDLQLGECQTHVTPNDSKPIVTQVVSIRLPVSGLAKDKFELLMLGAEFQNWIDAAIIDWSTRERSQYDNKPLRRPVSTVTGKLDYELVKTGGDSGRVMIYREFELTYAVTF